MTADFYTTIEQPSVAEFKDRGSKFIAFAFPLSSVADFKEKLSVLKKEHSKATHHCFAYRLGLDGTNYRVSDDGEPSGSAGRPVLGQIDSKELTNVLVVVVRYFGGTLLGVPGLINAYKNAASMALQLVPAIKKPVLVRYRLQFNYTLMNEVMIILKKYHCSVLKQENQLFCLLETGIPKDKSTDVLEKLGALQLSEIELI